MRERPKVMIYKCSELSDEENDLIALDRVSSRLLSKESELSGKCWFDYRFMHPTQRTYLFAHYYDEAYRHMLRLHVDYEQAEGPNPRSYFPKNDPLGKTQAQLSREKKTGVKVSFKNTTSIWKARQTADDLCVPYDVFCMSGVKAAVGRIWKRMPSPAQLYSDNILNAIIERWAEIASCKIYAARSDFFELKSWTNHPSQLEHASWLVSQISCRVNPELSLAQYGFVRKMIPSQMLKASFSEDVILNAFRLSKNLL